MGKVLALQYSVHDVKILKEVFWLTPIVSRVKDAFQCMACLDVMKLTVIFGTCCKS